MTLINLTFPVFGTTLPTDHSYPLFSALTSIVAAFHEPGAAFFFAPITGGYAGQGMIHLDQRSRLRCRLPADAIARALPLAGRSLNVTGHDIRLGVPNVSALVPATTVAAALVTFKHSTEPNRFLEVAQEKLKLLEVAGTPQLPVHTSGSRSGEPCRRIVRVAGKRVVGFATLVSGLTAAESIVLQERGLGGRTRMGCGFFVPVRG